MKALAEYRTGSSQDVSKGQQAHTDRTAQHKGETRVPWPGNIQKAQHFARVGHLRKG
jgi:hypothetical protein